MSGLTFEEKASTVGHVHSMILGGWKRRGSPGSQAPTTTPHNGPTAPTGADRKSAKKGRRAAGKGLRLHNKQFWSPYVDRAHEGELI